MTTKKKTTKPTYDQPETVAEFKAFGVRHKINIFCRGEQWHADYKFYPDYVTAGLMATTRAELLREVKRYLEGHGMCLITNLMEDVRA